MEEPKVYLQYPGLQVTWVWLDSRTYAETSPAFVKVVADVLIIDRGRKTVFLPRRVKKPAQGLWWVIGGRVLRGEDLRQAAQRHFLDDTGLYLALERLAFIYTSRYLWEDRQEDPQDAGTDDLAFTFTVELTEGELTQVRLRESEYDSFAGLQEFTRAALIRQGAYPLIIDLYDVVFPTPPQ